MAKAVKKKGDGLQVQYVGEEVTMQIYYAGSPENHSPSYKEFDISGIKHPVQYAFRKARQNATNPIHDREVAIGFSVTASSLVKIKGRRWPVRTEIITLRAESYFGKPVRRSKQHKDGYGDRELPVGVKVSNGAIYVVSKGGKIYDPNTFKVVFVQSPKSGPK